MVLNLLVKPGWVVVESLVQDRIGHVAFGTFTALSSLTLILVTLSDVGLTHYSVKRLAAEPGYLASHFPTILPLRGLLNGVALLMLLALGRLLGYDGAQLGLLAAIGAALLLTQYGQLLRGTLQAHQRFNTDALLSVLEKCCCWPWCWRCYRRGSRFGPTWGPAWWRPPSRPHFSTG
ncbi:MAG: hypothetical protein WKG07_46875 [Hymenobacter sp.]